MIERDRIVLPEPDSPTTPSVLPRSSVNDDAVDGPHHARAAVRKCVLRSCDLEQRRRSARRCADWSACCRHAPSLVVPPVVHGGSRRPRNGKATTVTVSTRAVVAIVRGVCDTCATTLGEVDPPSARGLVSRRHDP